MKTFVVILAIAAAASAAISEDYDFENLHTSYETPQERRSTGFNSGFAQTIGTGYKGQTSGGYQNQVSSSGAGYQTGSGYNTGSGYQTGGYNYQSGTGHPSGSSYQTVSSYPSSSGYQTGTGYQTGSGYQTGTGYQQTGTGYQTGGNYQSVADSSNNQYQSGSSSGVSNAGTGLSTGAGQGGYQGFNQYQTSSQYQSNSGFQQSYNQVQQQPPQIFKHFYVHAAPEEPEIVRPRQPVVLPAPQKHYKIIFIKTPTPVFNSAQYVPIQQQNEEKTIVYVLVKKPDAVEDVVLPQVEQKPPSKPEVYFIKYKGKEDSQAVINNIVSEYNSGKGTVNVAGAVQSSAGGTLDGISDAKYTAQSVSSGVQSGGVQTATQGSSGSFGSQSYESGGSSAGQTLSSSSGSSSSAFGVSGGSSGYQVSTGSPVQASTVTGGYESGLIASSVSSTESSAFVSGGVSQSNSIPTNQGIPHETYGPPKFKEY